MVRPEGNWDYSPSKVVSDRPMIFHETGIEGWRGVLGRVDVGEISWKGTGFGTGQVAYHTVGFQSMVIAGMQSFTFYTPLRVLRQFGRVQVIPPAESGTFVFPHFSAKSLRRYRGAWGGRELCHSLPNSDALVSLDYRQWLRSDVRRRNAW